MFVGAVFQPNVTIGDTQSHVASGLVTSSMTKVFTGGYIKFIAGLVFLVGRPGLTDRLLSQGASNPQIARTLGLSPKTVQNYVSRIVDKLQLADRTQAALYASRRQTKD